MYTSNKTLLQILVEELPKRGGWPEGTTRISQGAVTGCIYADGHRGLFLHNVYGGDDCVTRDQYEAALEASKELRPYQVSTGHYTSDAGAGKTASAADSDGWIEWAGGECPLEKGTIIDTKDRDGHENFGEVIGITNNVDNIFWQRGACSYPAYEIISYRLHQPQDANSRANDELMEADLNDCIGQAVPVPARWPLLADIHAAGIKIDLESAVFLADYLIDAGYRKQ